MRSDWPVREYKGLALVLVTAVAALWLAVTGQLTLYIHPRYILFTVILSAIAVVGVVFGMRFDYYEAGEGARRGRHIVSLAATAVCLFGVLGLLVFKPAPLTSATADQRGMNSSVSSVTSVQRPAYPPLFANDDYSSFTIKDWTSLLEQTDDPAYFIGKNVSILGFVVADKTDRDIFYISRFLVTCCAVDGRALGLPVHQPGWRDRFRENQWVQLHGTFVRNPSVSNADLVVIRPDKLEITGRPESVYVY